MPESSSSHPRSSSSPVSLSRHTLSQLKFIIPGGAITYYLGTPIEIWRIAEGFDEVDGWGRTTALASLGLGLTTVSLFLYVLLIPWIKGIKPNYKRWRESGVLSSVIPILTASIVLGWLLLVLTLGQWSRLGYITGVIAASGLYALTFGLMGLVPAPKVWHRH